MAIDPAPNSIRRAAIIAAALVIILAGLRAASSVATPLLTAWFVSMLLLPIYSWLRGKRLPSWAALLLLAGGVILIGLGLLWLVRTSVAQLTEGMSVYQDEMGQRLAELTASSGGSDGAATGAGLSGVVDPEQLTGILRSLLVSLGNVLATSAVTLILTVFLILEAPSLGVKLNMGLGEHNPVLERLRGLGASVVRYFGARTIVNAGTGAVVGLIFYLIGIDYALLWGVLIFFLSYVPYIGITLATIPAVLLGFAEFGVGVAILVIIIVVVANFTAENVFAPALTGKALSLSPTLVLVAFMFWSWMLGPLGFILSMPLTVAVMLLLDSFDETRWLALVMGMPQPQPDTA